MWKILQLRYTLPKQIYSLLWLFACLGCYEAAEKIQHEYHNCTKLLQELADSQKDFIQCTTLNARPVTMCQNCTTIHTRFTNRYDALVRNCSSEFFDNDRINMVAAGQMALCDLWERAFCDDCFRNDNSIEFNNKTDELEYCIESTTPKKDACTACLLFYKDLNMFYTDLEERNNGKVCFDLQDRMNQTRKQWSTDMNCCHRVVDRTLFIVAGSIISAIPVMFYVGIYFITKYQERNHDVLHEENSDLPSSVVPEPHTARRRPSADGISATAKFSQYGAVPIDAKHANRLDTVSD